jgi:hypothetical protein
MMAMVITVIATMVTLQQQGQGLDFTGLGIQ